MTTAEIPAFSMGIFKMTANDNYSFEPVGDVDPSAPPVAEAIPSKASSSSNDDETKSPSDTAIMVGCGLLGWVVAGPFLAILTALGGKYAADKYQGPIGDTARSVGRIAAAAGNKAKEEHLFCKLKAAIRSLFTRNDCQCKSCTCKN